MNDGILDEPLQPGALRVCPGCGKLFALEFVSKRQSKLQGTLSTFRCKKCGETFEFAKQHPPDTV